MPTFRYFRTSAYDNYVWAWDCEQRRGWWIKPVAAESHDSSLGLGPRLTAEGSIEITQRMVPHIIGREWAPAERFSPDRGRQASTYLLYKWTIQTDTVQCPVVAYEPVSERWYWVYRQYMRSSIGQLQDWHHGIGFNDDCSPMSPRGSMTARISIAEARRILPCVPFLSQGAPEQWDFSYQDTGVSVEEEEPYEHQLDNLG